MDEAAMPSLPDLGALLAEGGWYDLWHTHLDWRGEGNHEWGGRRAFLRDLFGLFDQIELRVRGWSKPAQVWVVVEESDSSQDAVYLHTPNPNRDNFPYTFEGVVWGTELPEWLREFVDPQRHEAGRGVFSGVVSFWVRPRGRG
jgi:hypothetical protein